MRKLWIWIALNVLGQLTNVIESILYILAAPPECLIIDDSEEASNILELFFALITMYLCFGSTIVYFTISASVEQEHFKSRLSESDHRQVNIELLPPLSRTASTPEWNNNQKNDSSTSSNKLINNQDHIHRFL